MGFSIFQRISDITRSNINALLDRCEDPAKMVDQMLLDLREKLAECRKQTGAVLAAEKQAKRALDECEENIKKYGSAARNALAAGEEGDARACLEKKQKWESQLPGLRAGYDSAKQAADRTRDDYQKLVSGIEDLEARRAGIKAKAATAKAQETMNRISAGVSAGASMEAFDRLEDKVDRRLDAAMAERDLNQASASADELVRRYAGSTSSVDDELAKLKAELGQS